jgi:hypothetical protein
MSSPLDPDNLAALLDPQHLAALRELADTNFFNGKPFSYYLTQMAPEDKRADWHTIVEHYHTTRPNDVFCLRDDGAWFIRLPQGCEYY